MKAIQNRYDDDSVWAHPDAWHVITSWSIQQAISRLTGEEDLTGRTILNLGSGGIGYGLRGGHHFHVDVALRTLLRTGGVQADVEELPIADGAADLVVCVGGVLNYGNPSRVIAEIARVLKAGSLAILEFESSSSLEFLGTSAFRKRSAEVVTFFNSRPERITVFGEEWILDELRRNGLMLTRSFSFHILSSFVYRITRNVRLASRCAAVDPWLRRLPLIRRCGANLLVGVRRL